MCRHVIFQFFISQLENAVIWQGQKYAYHRLAAKCFCISWKSNFSLFYHKNLRVIGISTFEYWFFNFWHILSCRETPNLMQKWLIFSANKICVSESFWASSCCSDVSLVPCRTIWFYTSFWNRYNCSNFHKIELSKSVQKRHFCLKLEPPGTLPNCDDIQNKMHFGTIHRKGFLHTKFERNPKGRDFWSGDS